MTYTFAHAILDEPCDHDWTLISSNWRGRSYECIYCMAQDYEENKMTMVDC